MGWVIALLAAILALLLQIARYLEPVRNYFQGRLDEEQEALENKQRERHEDEIDYKHFLAGSTPERAAAMLKAAKRMEADTTGPKRLIDESSGDQSEG